MRILIATMVLSAGACAVDVVEHEASQGEGSGSGHCLCQMTAVGSDGKGHMTCPSDFNSEDSPVGPGFIWYCPLSLDYYVPKHYDTCLEQSGTAAPFEDLLSYPTVCTTQGSNPPTALGQYYCFVEWTSQLTKRTYITCTNP